jgi:hypothetical protein
MALSEELLCHFGSATPLGGFTRIRLDAQLLQGNLELLVNFAVENSHVVAQD